MRAAARAGRTRPASATAPGWRLAQLRAAAKSRRYPSRLLPACGGVTQPRPALPCGKTLLLLTIRLPEVAGRGLGERMENAGNVLDHDAIIRNRITISSL